MRILSYISILLCSAAININTAMAAEESLVPRTIIALYDGNTSDTVTTNIHGMVEMPLNHLGLKVEYYDVHKPLPDITNRQDVRGVVTWLFFDTKMENPEAYIKWATAAVNSGKKYVILGTLGVMSSDARPSVALVNSFMGKLGLKVTNGWTETAFDVTYSYNTADIFLAKEAFNWTRPSYETILSVDTNNSVHLAAKKGNTSEENSDLIITGPNGGYISSGYIIKSDVVAGRNSRQWIVNPFQYFRLALGTDDLPKPDTTTIAGRRIYYSHIDGDGFNSVTQLEEYRDKNTLSAQVIMDKAIKPYPDLPVTLTVIAADIDPQWAATDTSRAVAKDLFKLTQVEAGSHTYSHPFNWEFFRDGNSSKEIPYLRSYPQNSKHTVWKPSDEQKSPGFFNIFSDKKHATAEAMPDGNARPRAFAHEPFDIQKEIQGSIKEINTVLPKGKKVELVMWSGDCSPWEEVVHQSRLAGVQNINGGDTMFDSQHPAYATVAPVGRQVGKELQIYASTSNEIPYTNEWTENFDGYRHLKETLINTESPIRLKPLNIYYHLYSGEKESGLNALLANLDFARTQNIAPITTSYYTHIAEGFYETKLIKIAPDTWRVDKRGSLATIRFDRHTFKSVNFERSKGVIGQRHLQGSLYVYLDATEPRPVIAIKDNSNYSSIPEESAPYLVESRWLISNLRKSGAGINFTAEGFGDGDMIWNVPVDGNYRININGKDIAVVPSNNRNLQLNLKQKATSPQQLTITRI